MTEFPPYFPKRFPQDRLDIAPLLFEGLRSVDGRCILACEGREVTGAELGARAATLQASLAARGLKAGDRVAVMLSNSLDHIALLYALFLSGIVWVPVNVRLRGAALAYVLEHSRPALLVFDEEFEEAVACLAAASPCRLDDLAPTVSSDGVAALRVRLETAPSDTLCIIYTSGTTGPPKGVMFTHRMMRIAGEAVLRVAAIGDGDRAFLWEPLCHIGGAQMLMVPFLAGAQLHVVKRFSSRLFRGQWQSARATHFHYLGGVLDLLMRLPDSDTQPPPSIRVAWGAGASALSWAGIRDRFGCELRECYGMTECSSFATLNESGTPGSIGAPLPWMRIDLLDDAGQAVAAGEIGEIVLSSDLEGVFLPGYLDNPEATAKVIRDGRLHTGDMARELPGGEFAFVGRRTDSMRVRGENVSAWEVERVFARHPCIEAVAAVGVPGEIGEQDILLYVQFKDGRCAIWSELAEWARPRLAAFQLPRYYAVVERFELTPSERIRKHLLPRTAQGAWDRAAIDTRQRGERS
ncbi:MAG TPA: AMP-binding protein [Ramlibacter sp.]|uniref:AMP-binding protein n=1 Tax=Ramlibacter sp. TaxID=1917967 RepID=UPI002B8A0F63|nr:AMP-binding protein [Ramlibacter sp.]HVZ45188.1 AMP-binding protein [Ramlibacter sp.]